MSDFVQPDWWNDAACVGSRIDFFPSRGEDPRPAKRVCVECPVREECLQWALDTKEAHGIWGGLSERERRRIRRSTKRISVCVSCGASITSARSRIYCDGCSAKRRRESHTLAMRAQRA